MFGKVWECLERWKGMKGRRGGERVFLSSIRVALVEKDCPKSVTY